MPKNYHLYLKGDVGGWDFSSDQVSYILDRHKEENVNVLIDSLGGRVDTALSISALFKNHGSVYCHYVGMSASAATIASMGAKHISMDAHALYLVHKCLGLVFEWDYFNADDLAVKIKQLEKQADQQTKIDNTIAGLYASRCKKPQADLLELMKKGGWLTAKEALDWGFVDEITDADEDAAPSPVDDSKAEFMAQAGIPIPKTLVKKESMVARILAAIGSLMNNEKIESKAGPVASADQTPIPMNDKFPLLAAILGAAATLADGKLTLAENQLTTLETLLANKAKELAELKAAAATDKTALADAAKKSASLEAKVKELEARVADLAKAPAAETTTVTQANASNADPDAPTDDTAAEVRNLLAQLL